MIADNERFGDPSGCDHCWHLDGHGHGADLQVVCCVCFRIGLVRASDGKLREVMHNHFPSAAGAERTA